MNTLTRSLMSIWLQGVGLGLGLAVAATHFSGEVGLIVAGVFLITLGYLLGATGPTPARAGGRS